jgi:hypothetical protein
MVRDSPHGNDGTVDAPEDAAQVVEDAWAFIRED